jgi:hypothetical protein
MDLKVTGSCVIFSLPFKLLACSDYKQPVQTVSSFYRTSWHVYTVRAALVLRFQVIFHFGPQSGCPDLRFWWFSSVVQANISALS